MNRKTAADKPLPNGDVTFLFTDIEGSTRHWERSPDAMRRGLTRHDEILHKAIDESGGVVFKTVGDSFFAVFQDPIGAIRAAADAQYALANEPWPRALGGLFVRIGIYSGTPVLRGTDYFGPTVNRVARLTAAAHGGQILVANATAELARKGDLGEIRLHDLGMHRLRDLTDAEHIFQVMGPGLSKELRPPASLDATPNNLPSQISTFIGRTTDRKQLRKLLRDHALVTVAGLGGIGKTRLALDVAEELLGGFTGGCWFVSLKEVDDPVQIAQATADALRLRGLPGEPIEESLVEHLLKSRTLIVVDNAEHLLEGTAMFLKRLLERVSRIRVIVTSREPLHVPGERVLRIGPLEEAASLFVDRVRALGNDPPKTPEATKAIVNICAKLQGIPLAIELAAVRAGSMPVTALDELLSSQLQLLLSPNHSEGVNSLDAMLEWSYRLLKPAEKKFLMHLAIFDGSFTLEAAEAVAGDGQRGEALSLLGSLSDKSLVTYSVEAGISRYYLLDVIRSFALERLRKAGDAESHHRRHSTYFFGLVQSLTASGTSGELTVARLTQEWSNIRTALRYTLDEGRDLEAGHWAVRRLWEFWMATGRTSEGWYWINRALAEADVPPQMRAELLQRAAQIASLRRDYQAMDVLSKLLVEMHETSGDSIALGYALELSGSAKAGLGNGVDAELQLRRSLEQFRAAGDRRGIALTLANLGTIAGLQHLNFPAAQRLLLHSLEIFQELDVPLSCAAVLGNLSVTSMRTGDRVQALSYAHQSLAILERLGNQAEAGIQHVNIAEIYVETGALNAAGIALRDARRSLGDDPNPMYLAYYFEAAFKLAVELGAKETAARMYGFAERYRGTTSNPLQPLERTAMDAFLARLTRAIGSAEFERLSTLGRTMGAAAMEGAIASLGSAPSQPPAAR